MRTRSRLGWWFAALIAALVSAAGCGNDGGGKAAPGKKRFAFVTNCALEFWAVAKAGVEAAKADFGCEVLVRMPPTGTAQEQKQALEDAVAAGVDGIAVSPKDPQNMTALLDDIAGRCLLITHDSDAPASQRLCYIGVDNYAAGRMCGQLIKEALPDGGAVVLVIGTLDQDNSRRRRQGVIDELLDRDADASRFDAIDAVLKNDRFEVRATFTDQIDPQKAKAVVEDSLTRWSDLKALVGLFAHEAPLMADAVRAAGRKGEVAIVGFDEAEGTLQGIVDGTIHGTVVQNPFDYGYRSIELLAKLAGEPDPARRAALLPPDGMLVVPARQIRKDSVDAFWADLKRKLGRR